MKAVLGRVSGTTIELLEPIDAREGTHVLVVSLEGEMERAAARIERQGVSVPIYPPERYADATKRAIASAASAPETKQIRPFSVGEVMTEKVITVSPRMPAVDAMHLMAQQGITSVVVEPGAAGDWGIMTIRDVLERIVRANRSPQHVAVGEMASRPLITVDAAMTLRACSELMVERKIRRAVVMRDGQPFGIISETDIFRVVEQHGWEPSLSRADTDR